MPSRKLLRTGTSMIRPDGSAIRPRMAPSWPMLPLFPRAPEAVIIVTGPVGSSDRIISSDIAGAGLLPDADDLLVALVLGDEAALELLVDRGDGVVGRLEACRLVGRDLDVEQADRHAAAGGELEADALDAVDEVGRLLRAELAVADVDQLLEVGPAHDRVVEAERDRAGSG